MYEVTNKKQHFTIIRYEVMDDLLIDFEEYMILDFMLFRSVKNKYTKGKSILSNVLCLSRGTIDDRFKKLIEKEHVIKDEFSNSYYLNNDIKERMEINKGNYVVDFHHKRKELGLKKVRHFIFLHLVYSLSKTKGYAYMGKQNYMKHLRFSTNKDEGRGFKYLVKNAESKGFIETKKYTTFYKLNSELFDWFEENTRSA